LLVTQPLYSHAGVWADFDNDGLIDLFVVNFTILGSGVAAGDNYQYHNAGDGTLDRISFGTKSLTNGDSWNVAAADFNNDGWIDLFVPQGGTQISQNNLLYANNGGAFTLLTNSTVLTNKANGVACAWGDYDNDGFLDLFVSNFYEQNNFLYHNNGDGTFTSITNSPATLDGGTSVGCAWGDYDNDGWLDLFVANLGPVNSNTVTSIAPENNFLYHNNGDGTFTKITTGSLVNDLGHSTGCAWADYDNDGFLDLFVSNGWTDFSENNFLYRNNGNANNWITFKLVGTLSNRAAIGAKVRVKATIGGNPVWQMREISGGSNYGSQNDMRPSFGLGDATNIDLVQIEWPSGIVQTMTNVAAKQFLRVEEHQVLGGVIAPGSTSVLRSVKGVVDLSVTGDTGLRYLFEASTNLVNWSWLGVRTNLTGTVQFTDPRATNFTKRFYRVLIP
jgi:enediyne biosynthesis protein E4